MRINVYSQELTKEVCMVRKTDEKGVTHRGVRIFFDGSPRLHHTAEDDDRSAITFWLPNTAEFGALDLARVLWDAGNEIVMDELKESRDKVQEWARRGGRGPAFGEGWDSATEEPIPD